MRRLLEYTVREIRPYINWAYFYHAWQVNGTQHDGREALQADAQRMLDDFDRDYHTKAVLMLCEANSDGDDIVVAGKTRIPMLRQQTPDSGDQPCLCLADFIRPVSSGKADQIGLFATTVDRRMETEHVGDPYTRMLAQTLADRLAEATAERLHEQVRKDLWGYGREERLTIPQMLRGEYVGIRPAVGYPSMPDTSVNFILSDLLNMPEIGIRLTESGAMRPHASVSGLLIAHPRACYFNLGQVGDDQLADYARRRGVPVALARRFLESVLINR